MTDTKDYRPGMGRRARGSGIEIVREGMRPACEWKCPICYHSIAEMQYKPEKPIPNCANRHPPTALVPNDLALAQDIHARYKAGEAFGPPMIHPRNAVHFPKRRPAGAAEIKFKYGEGD